MASLRAALATRPLAQLRGLPVREEAPTLRVTARSGAATWHGASGESRGRTRTCFAFERGARTSDRRERVCGGGGGGGVTGGALRLQRLAQASNGLERGALTLTVRVHYATVSKMPYAGL